MRNHEEPLLGTVGAWERPGRFWSCGSAEEGGPRHTFLSETKMSKKKLNKFRIKLGLMHMVARDCDGKSGGDALFWKRGRNVSLRWKGHMHIDATIIEDEGFKGRLTGIYGDPKEKSKHGDSFVPCIIKRSSHEFESVISMRLCLIMRIKGVYHIVKHVCKNFVMFCCIVTSKIWILRVMFSRGEIITFELMGIFGKGSIGLLLLLLVCSFSRIQGCKW